MTFGGESMAVYNYNRPHRDNARLYRGLRREPAVDLPPCRIDENKFERKDDAPQNDKKLFGGLADELFEGGIDSDKLLIAALLYILMKEGADIKLIIALGYILM